MTKKNTIATEEVSTPAYSFPAALVKPPADQLTRWSDAVSEKIREFDHRAEKFGLAMGVASDEFDLADYTTSAADGTVFVLERMAIPKEVVMLDKVAGRWGLYWQRGLVLFGAPTGVNPKVLLEQAPLSVRELFLKKSDAFFERYLAKCEDRLSKMKGAVSAANMTLAKLDAITLR